MASQAAVSKGESIKHANSVDERTPEKSPILNNPYDHPIEYWELDRKGVATNTLMHGRRPSAPYPMVPHSGGRQRQITEAEKEMHLRINMIRDHVNKWREDGYLGISPAIIRLLEYWNQEEQSGTRPFFCQITAVETLVWLCDVQESDDAKLSQFREEIHRACQKHNGNILRYATKMATGAGKTIVMGMLIAWQALREQGRTDTLVMVPNLTIKDRLKVLIPSDEENIYKDILPRGQKLPDDTRVSVINYHAFQTRSTLEINPNESVNSKTRRLITAGQKEPDSWREAPHTMLDRILPSHRGASKITVINDEAHHCYRPDDPNARPDKDEVINPREAALWFAALQHLWDEDRLGMVFDMSATPMFIASASKADTELFPWVVSDYPLIDSIEAGLAKIPRVPVKDLTKHDQPKFRNIFQYIPKAERKLRHDDMNDDVKDLLERLQIRYKKETNRYAKDGKIPVMIVVAYPIENAQAIYKHLAGYEEDGKWVEGYEMFSNIEKGKPKDSPFTLLVTSDMDELDESAWKNLAINSETFFPNNASKKEKISHIREVFRTVGQKGKAGEHIRCVVSVNMLTEGWDAKTVTHIFGYRPFKSELLCEQVAGRALRRSNLPAGGLDKGELLPPEYAGIFGIPFSFALGTGESQESENKSWNVKTEEGREHLRMSFPNIRAYKTNAETSAMILDVSKIKEYKLANPVKPGDVTVSGMTGEQIEMLDQMRSQRAIYELAEHITRRFCGKGDGKTTFFNSSLAAVHKWIEHPNVECDDIRMLAYAPNLDMAAEAIWAASTVKNGKPPIIPVFADSGDSSQDHEYTTENVDFDTTKRHKYPENGIPAKSELSAAACDSYEEVQVAQILDEHDNIETWVRNHRIGWSIPYIDPKTGGWREYIPDFIARVKGGKSHLVIEYKGREDTDAQAKKRWAEEYWCPAVSASDDPACNGKWKYVYLDTEARIGTELDDAIKEELG